MTDNTQGLDDIIAELTRNAGKNNTKNGSNILNLAKGANADYELRERARQAILRWVNDEVIGKDVECDGTCDDGAHKAEQRRINEQRAVLKQHGFKQEGDK